MRKRYVAVLALGVFLVLGAFFITLFHTAARSVDDIRTCVEKRSRPLDVPCIRNLVSELLDTMPTKELMQQVEAAIPRECHVIGHIIGQETAKRFPSAEAALSQCSPGLCAQACLHGALGEIFFTASGFSGDRDALEHLDFDFVRAEAKRLCTNRVTCHAMGHVFFIFLGDLLKALTMCETLSPGGVASCYTGVFMENASGMYTQTMPEDMRPTRILDPFDLLSPCPAVPERYQEYCFRFLYVSQIAAFQEQGITDEDKMLSMQKAACDTISVSKNRTSCFRSFGWSLREPWREFAGARDRCQRLESVGDESACLFGAAFAYSSFGTKPFDILNECLGVGDSSKQLCHQGLFFSLWDIDTSVLRRACDGSVDSTCHASLQSFIDTNVEESVPKR